MVIIRTRATEVSIQAVSPELGVQFCRIFGVAVPSQAGAAAAPGAAGAPVALGVAAAGAGAGPAGWAQAGAGTSKPASAARIAATIQARVTLPTMPSSPYPFAMS